MDVYARDFEKQDIIKEMIFRDKGFFSPVMFIRKGREISWDNIRQEIDFRLLNTYSHT